MTACSSAATSSLSRARTRAGPATAVPRARRGSMSCWGPAARRRSAGSLAVRLRVQALAISPPQLAQLPQERRPREVVRQPGAVPYSSSTAASSASSSARMVAVGSHVAEEVLGAEVEAPMSGRPCEGHGPGKAAHAGERRVVGGFGCSRGDRPGRDRERLEDRGLARSVLAHEQRHGRLEAERAQRADDRDPNGSRSRRGRRQCVRRAGGSRGQRAGARTRGSSRAAPPRRESARRRRRRLAHRPWARPAEAEAQVLAAAGHHRGPASRTRST